MMDNETKIREIMEVADEVLTEWEFNFMQSIGRRHPENLTVGMQDKLDEIYEKVCRSPY